MAYYVITLLGKDPKVNGSTYERLYLQLNRYSDNIFTSSIDKAWLFKSVQDIWQFIYANKNMESGLEYALRKIDYQEGSLDIRKVLMSAKKVMEEIDLSKDYKEIYEDWAKKRHELLTAQERENKNKGDDYSS